MLRMGKLTDYATVVLASLAQEPALTLAAAELAERTRLSRPTVSKVLKGLQTRRPGDFPRAVHKADIVWHEVPGRLPRGTNSRRIRGPHRNHTECSGASSQCGIERQCRVGGAWQRVNAGIRRALEEVTLRQLAGLDSATLRVADLASEIRVNTW